MAFHFTIILAVGLQCLTSTHAQEIELLSVQTNTWNSSFALSPDQIARAELDNRLARNIDVAIRFEQTNWAGNSAAADPFYIPPANSTSSVPGSLLAVEARTNASLYTLPPDTALSRIIFQSESFNGSAVPASAYVLWPYMPRTDPRCSNRYVVVGWAHGNSGCFGECAPSHIRNLWYQYSAPYTLALQGYVVVAPDYAGLGVTQFPNSTEIKHQFITGPAHANDLFHAVKAAQTAFPELSSNFVLVGHSQGGAATWAAAQRQAQRPVTGYLGAVVGSPGTDVRAMASTRPITGLLFAFLAGHGLDSIFPDFRISRWLTEKGIRFLELAKEIKTCNSGWLQLLTQQDVLKPDFVNTTSFQSFAELAKNGGKPIAGPMLVLQGGNDALVAPEPVTSAVNETCSKFPDSQVDYVFLQGGDHGASMYAGQRVWLEWIADRFAGKEVEPGCRSQNLSSARPIGDYQANLNFYLEYATQSYQVA